MTDARGARDTTSVLERAAALMATGAFLPESLAELGPNVIGATGGSGTRVVARIIRTAGMFIGTKLNHALDPVEFGHFEDRWINVLAGDRVETVPAETWRAMSDDLRELVSLHVSPIVAAPRVWGWKAPRSIFLLPVFHALIPSLRFLHFVRDGRDMAFSSNQNQLKKHGRAVLGTRSRANDPRRSIWLWTEVNLGASDFGERVLGDRYIRIRFEDLCFDPVSTVTRILDFFGLSGDAEALARAEIRPPATVGRWSSHDRRTVADLHDIARPALEKFGYLD